MFIVYDIDSNDVLDIHVCKNIKLPGDHVWGTPRTEPAIFSKYCLHCLYRKESADFNDKTGCIDMVIACDHKENIMGQCVIGHCPLLDSPDIIDE